MDLLEEYPFGGTRLVIWISTDAADAGWDRFLEENPFGQFQQSAMWAAARRSEDWTPLRVIVKEDESIVAGFQILWRRSWLGRIGYVSKGPVVSPGRVDLAGYLVHLLQKVARRQKLCALVVQPPDSAPEISDRLDSAGFDPDVLARVNEATIVTDLRQGFEALERRMGRSARKHARHAMESGVTIREGGRSDLATFFELMCSSCRRQGVAPNPSELRHLVSLWDAASPSGHIRLWFADYAGEPISAQLLILFGRAATFWKTGWNSKAAELRPNHLLMYEDLKWASHKGFDFSDFASLDKQMAMALLRGEAPSAEQENSRYTFLLRFGGSPRLLPEARIYIPNPAARSAYRLLLRQKIRRAESENRSVRDLIRRTA